MSPDDIQDLRDRLTRLDTKVDELAVNVAKMVGSADNLHTIVTYIVLPLIIILGALIGVKLVMPTGG